jgi:hypothetical protein
MHKTMNSAKVSPPTLPVPSYSSSKAVQRVDYHIEEEIGCISVYADGRYLYDRSRLRFYSPPDELLSGRNARVNWDLNVGFENFTRRDERVHKCLDALLIWLQQHRDITIEGGDGNDVTTQNDKLASNNFADIICWGNVLKTILCTPYENTARNDGWKIAVCRHNGIMYFYDFDVVEYQFQIPEMYHGFKFETLLTVDKVDSLPDPSTPIHNTEAFLPVVRARLGTRHNIVFSSEVDCCEKDNPHEYIELKTKNIIQDDRQRKIFHRYAMRKWWAQSALNGTNKIVCGFKDTNAVVRELRSYNTSDIPEECEKVLRWDSWKPDVCWQFLDQFLQYVKDTVKQDYNEAIYVFSFLPRTNPDEVTVEVVSPPGSPYLFLPAWFTNDTTNSRPNSDTM